MRASANCVQGSRLSPLLAGVGLITVGTIPLASLSAALPSGTGRYRCRRGDLDTDRNIGWCAGFRLSMGMDSRSIRKQARDAFGHAITGRHALFLVVPAGAGALSLLLALGAAFAQGVVKPWVGHRRRPSALRQHRAATSQSRLHGHLQRMHRLHCRHESSHQRLSDRHLSRHACTVRHGIAQSVHAADLACDLRCRC